MIASILYVVTRLIIVIDIFRSRCQSRAINCFVPHEVVENEAKRQRYAVREDAKRGR